MDKSDGQLAKDLKDKTSRWMLGIGVGLASYVGLMTLTTALHITVDLSGWELVALTSGGALSALIISGVVILGMSDLQPSHRPDHHEERPIKRDLERPQKVA